MAMFYSMWGTIKVWRRVTNTDKAGCDIKWQIGTYVTLVTFVTQCAILPSQYSIQYKLYQLIQPNDTDWDVVQIEYFNFLQEWTVNITCLSLIPLN